LIVGKAALTVGFLMLLAVAQNMDLRYNSGEKTPLKKG